MFSHLYELVEERARSYPAEIAFGGQDNLVWRTVSGTQFQALVDSLAAELASIGVRESDRVLLWLPSHWRTPVYFFALWKLGAIAVPFDHEMNPEAGARILESIDPRCVISGYPERPAWLGSREATTWWEPGSRLPASPDAGEWRRPREELAAIVFTSGTTGTPKGCMITHANFCSQIAALQDNILLGPACRMASILPLSHLLELTAGMLYPFSMGAAVHYVPSRRGPDVVRVLSAQRITHMLVVPQFLTLMGQTLDEQLRARLPGPIYRTMAALAPRLPLPARRTLYWPASSRLGGHLRMIVSGGASLPAATQLLWERLGVRVVQGYGASECSPTIAGGLEDGSTPLGSVGRPIRGVEVRLGADGELLVRGPNVMRGYWNDPERTAEVLHDGWYATGDLASLDAAGNITIAGRAKDLIALPSGMKVWPQDVEDVLRSDPLVKDAAVIAVPSSGGRATLHAYLLPAHAGLSEGELTAIAARCNARLAPHQRVATASWWPEADFPRTNIGKVRRVMLPPPETAHATHIESALAADDPVTQAVAGVARVPRVQPDQTLAALGLDSLGLVELSLEIEDKTGKAIGEAELTTDMTVEQLRALVTKAPEVSSDDTSGREQPIWPYTWGRMFRGLSLPIDLLYQLRVTKTIVLGAENLERLPRRAIFAGTHHSFADMPLVRYALAQSSAPAATRRLAIATSSGGRVLHPAAYWWAVLAFGLYPINQRGERSASLRGLARVAATGNAVLIFPQGSHIKPEQERAGAPEAGFHPGVARLAESLGATVVPFGLAGTDVMMPPDPATFHGKVFAGVPVSIKRGPLAIVFGKPMALEPGESAQAFTDRLQAECFALTRQAEDALTGEDAQHGGENERRPSVQAGG